MIIIQIILLFLFNTVHCESQIEEDLFIRSNSPSKDASFYSVHIASWNVAGKKPSQNLLPLLGINDTFSPDFIVVGIQESIDAKIDVKFLTHHSKWPAAVESELKPYGYEKVGLVQNKAMELMVYVKTEHSKLLEQFEKVTKNNYLHIKGGISLRFVFNWKKIAFTNSHLPAGQNENHEREKSYNEIKNKPFSTSGYLSDHDYHFWFGDLNFRLEHESPEHAMKIINSIEETTDPESRRADLETLLHKDQLKASQEAGRAFSDYKEAEINFLPTYKFLENTSNYVLSRQPSYCDRILAKKLAPTKDLEISEVFYEPKIQYIASDHKPITALFYIKV